MTKTITNLLKLSALAACVAILPGCAGVPMASQAANLEAKSFPTPQSGKSGLFVYRDSFVGKALKKDVYVDGKCLGETADKVFFHTQVDGNRMHTVSTESEFSPNDIQLDTVAGESYYIRQYIKMGLFVGGAGLEKVSEEEGRRVLSKPSVNLALEGKCDNQIVIK